MKTLRQIVLLCLLIGALSAPSCAQYGTGWSAFSKGLAEGIQRGIEARRQQELLNQQEEALRLYEEQVRAEMDRIRLLREAERRNSLQSTRQLLESLMNDPKWRRWADDATEAELLRRINEVYKELGAPELRELPPVPTGFTPGSVEKIVSESRGGVVYIECRPTEGEGSTSGTGFIILPDGLIITCAHVLRPPLHKSEQKPSGGRKITLRMDGGQSYSPAVVYEDAKSDLALLYVKATGLRYLPFSSFDVSLGEDILVLGYPLGDSLGRELTVTRGIVSSVRSGGKVVQLDAATNPGNSGGPVLNSFGEVVGVAFAKMKDYEGLNFAVASKAIPSVPYMVEHSQIWAAALADAMIKDNAKDASDLLDQHKWLATEALDDDGWRAVHVAALVGKLPMLDTLLQRGASVNEPRNDGATALILAAGAGRKEQVDRLLEKGADVNAVTKDGVTALTSALTESPPGQALDTAFVDIAKTLIEHGAKLDTPSPQGISALLLLMQHPNTLDLALEAAGKIQDIEARDADGQTALILAAKDPRMNSIARVLLARGANVNACSRDGFTPLHQAVLGDNLALLRILLGKGCSLEARTKYASGGELVKLAGGDPRNADGWTPLLAAAATGKTGAVLALLRSGAKIGATNSVGFTALHLAAANGHMKTAKLLVARGAKLGAAPGSNVPTAAQVARHYGHADLAEFLEAARGPKSK